MKTSWFRIIFEYSLELKLPDFNIRFDNCFDNEWENTLVSLCCTWIFDSPNLSMVVSNVIIKIMRIHESAKGPCTKDLIQNSSFMQDFMSSNRCITCRNTSGHYGLYVLRWSFRPMLPQNRFSIIILATNQHQNPSPNTCFNN